MAITVVTSTGAEVLEAVNSAVTLLTLEMLKIYLPFSSAAISLSFTNTLLTVYPSSGVIVISTLVPITPLFLSALIVPCSG